MSIPRSVAFYLPQYHPIEQNDRWWGAGFTDWRNVAGSRPRFRGHYQPHVPADLGFYDLRLDEVRCEQAALAAEYGISGFCYYHYWFSGRQILEMPLERLLQSSEPDFPFMVCWANEPWSRRWDGSDHDVLLAQRYSEEDHRRHTQHLVKIFEDRRYLRIDGKPIFAVYRSIDIPDVRRATDLWREEASKCGIGDLYLCRIEGFHGKAVDPRQEGFDASIQFHPNQQLLPDRINLGPIGRVARRIVRPSSGYRMNNVYDYESYVDNAIGARPVEYPRFLGAMPGWDNSARRSSWAMIFHRPSPKVFEKWMTANIRAVLKGAASREFIFINAWNEWAEGAHLEPDYQFGLANLEAHLRAYQNCGLLLDLPLDGSVNVG